VPTSTIGSSKLNLNPTKPILFDKRLIPEEDEINLRQYGRSSSICMGKISGEESAWASRISIGHHAELDLHREDVRFKD
jgi:hypothetical protein